MKFILNIPNISCMDFKTKCKALSIQTAIFLQSITVDFIYFHAHLVDRCNTLLQQVFILRQPEGKKRKSLRAASGFLSMFVFTQSVSEPDLTQNCTSYDTVQRTLCYHFP